MKSRIFQYYRYLIALSEICTLLIASGCTKEEPIEELPVDGYPFIQRIYPNQPNGVIGRAPQEANITFLVGDNEELASLKIYESAIVGAHYIDTTIQVGSIFRDTTILVGDTVLKKRIIKDEKIKGNSLQYNLKYQVPEDIVPFARVILTATVADVKNQTRSASYILSFDPSYGTIEDDSLGKFFNLLSYQNDTIFNAKTALAIGLKKTSFNLIARQHATGESVAAQDIAEITVSADAFKAAFSSPAQGLEPSLAVMKPTILNYDLLTYSILHRAYLTSTPKLTTSELSPGDIVLVKLSLKHKTLKQYNHYAAVRINRIVRDSRKTGEDFIIFDYKRSQDRE